MAWNDERVATLKKMWGEGASCSQIAGELANGITRNAVIGKIHRLGLGGRAKTHNSPAPRPSRARFAHNPRAFGGASNRVSRLTGLSVTTKPIGPHAEHAPYVEPALDEPLTNCRVSLLELKPDHCRWPFGDPRADGFRFCGAIKPAEVSYCRFHAQLAYQPGQPRGRGRPAADREAA